MKKGIIVLLITVLAAGMVFADFSGDAYIQFNADLDNKDYGFANGNDFGFSFTVDSEVTKINGESPIHAVVEATANLIVDSKAGDKGSDVFASDGGSYGYGIIFNLKKAMIVGENWTVAITGAKSAYNYASASAFQVASKSGKDSFGYAYYNKYSGASYSVAYSKAPGLTVTYNGYTASFGFTRTGAKGTAVSATIETKEFSFSDNAVKVQAAAEASKKAGVKDVNLGISAKATIALDEVSIKVATDVGIEGIRTDEVKVQFDASLAASYDFLSATAYLFKGTLLAKTYKDFYLEATLAANLSKFEVPVSISFKAKNLVDKSDAGVVLSTSASYSQDAITAGASFGLNSKTSAWTLNAYGIYAAEKFTAGGNVYYSSATKAVSFGAFAESSTVIEGVTVGLSYGLDNTTAMYYGGSYCVSSAVNSNSFAEEKVAGTAGAYCIINF